MGVSLVAAVADACAMVATCTAVVAACAAVGLLVTAAAVARATGWQIERVGEEGRGWFVGKEAALGGAHQLRRNFKIGFEQNMGTHGQFGTDGDVTRSRAEGTPIGGAHHLASRHSAQPARPPPLARSLAGSPSGRRHPPPLARSRQRGHPALHVRPRRHHGRARLGRTYFGCRSSSASLPAWRPAGSGTPPALADLAMSLPSARPRHCPARPHGRGHGGRVRFK